MGSVPAHCRCRRLLSAGAELYAEAAAPAPAGRSTGATLIAQAGRTSTGRPAQEWEGEASQPPRTRKFIPLQPQRGLKGGVKREGLWQRSAQVVVCQVHQLQELEVLEGCRDGAGELQGSTQALL